MKARYRSSVFLGVYIEITQQCFPHGLFYVTFCRPILLQCAVLVQVFDYHLGTRGSRG